MESEYEILGYKEGEGRDKGTVIWICKVYKDSKESTFSVRPKGTLEFRKELFKNGDLYIGKKLTVILIIGLYHFIKKNNLSYELIYNYTL